MWVEKKKLAMVLLLYYFLPVLALIISAARGQKLKVLNVEKVITF